MKIEDCKIGDIVIGPAGRKSFKVGRVVELDGTHARVFWYAMKNRTWMRIQSLSMQPVQLSDNLDAG